MREQASTAAWRGCGAGPVARLVLAVVATLALCTARIASGSAGPGEAAGTCGSGPGGSGPVGAKCSNREALVSVQPFDHLSTNPSHPTVVTVTGTGFGPNEVVGTELCRAVVNSSNDCDGNTAITGRTSASGTFSLNLSAALEPDGTIHTSNGNVRCDETGNCSIGASNFSEPGSSTQQHASNEDVGFGAAVASTPTPTAAPTSASTTATPTASASPAASASIPPGRLAGSGGSRPPPPATISGGTQLAIGFAGLGVILGGAAAGWLLASRRVQRNASGGRASS